MYALGHVGIALLVFAPVGYAFRHRKRAAVAGAFGVACLSTLPDVDQYTAALPHRGVTHTVWFALVVGALLGTAAGVRSRRGRRGDGASRFVGGAGVGTLAVTAHLLGDVITPMGISPLAPAVEWHVTLSLVYARNPTANEGFFLLGALATTLYLAPVRPRTPPLRVGGGGRVGRLLRTLRGSEDEVV